jgi:hypothetical protein
VEIYLKKYYFYLLYYIMPGGLLSILSYGSTDLFLTGAPQITFFKVVYRRHTNFSVESVEIGLNTNVNFNEEYEVIVDRIGDLIGKTYLKIKIPEVYFSRTEFSLPESDATFPNIIYDYYKTVEDFMRYNMNAYRKCYDNSELVNVSSAKFLSDINTVFSGDAHTSLNKFIELQDSLLNNYSEVSTMMYNSNIYNIYLKYQDTSIDKETLFEYVKTCVIFSKRCQKYFWESYNNLNQEFIRGSTNNLKFAWNNNIGHNIIEYIDVKLGGDIIDRQYGDFFETSYQIRKTDGVDITYKNMIGTREDLIKYDENIKPSYIIMIPLKFWFNKNMGSAFPLIASQYTDLSFRIKFRNINQCGLVEYVQPTTDEVYTLEDLWNDKQYKLEVSLLPDYVFLDYTERRKFAQSSHEYLIENIQTVTERLSNYSSENNVSKLTNESIINNTINFNINLDFKHPCKQLIWTLQKEKYIENKGGTQKCIFDTYSLNTREDKDPLIAGNLLLNGYDRLNKRVCTSKYFNLIQGYQHNTTISDCGIYSYSFSFFPEELQPSGSCNFGRFLGQNFGLDIDENMFYYATSDIDPKIEYNSNDDVIYNYTDVILNIYAAGYNILRINGGFAGLAFSFT